MLSDSVDKLWLILNLVLSNFERSEITDLEIDSSVKMKENKALKRAYSIVVTRIHGMD